MKWIFLLLGTAILLASIVAEFTMLGEHGSHWWNHIPVFYGLWGGLSAFVLIALAALLGRILKKDVDYYDD